MKLQPGKYYVVNNNLNVLDYRYRVLSWENIHEIGYRPWSFDTLQEAIEAKDCYLKLNQDYKDHEIIILHFAL